jgi:RNA polymerase sigma factor (sigma-70 family)
MPCDLPTGSVTDHAFQEMLCANVNPLVRYIERFIPADLRSLIDPQDVVQDTFFNAARVADTVVPGDSDWAWRWLVAIARNRLRDLIEANRATKRGGRIQHLQQEELRYGSVIDMLQELAVDRRTPSKSAVRKEFLVVLERSIGQLQPAYQEAIRLRYIEGLSLQDTAGHLNRTTDSAQKLCARGLEALRIELRTISLYM